MLALLVPVRAPRITIGITQCNSITHFKGFVNKAWDSFGEFFLIFSE